jgi:hypothetical protein
MILIAGVAGEKVDFSARSRIGVAKSSYHHQSRNETGVGTRAITPASQQPD